MRTKTGEVSYNMVRRICFVLENVISDIKCCKGQRRKLEAKDRLLDLMFRKVLGRLRALLS